MKIRYAALLSGLSLLASGLYTAFVLQNGLRIAGDLTLRTAWLQENAGLWSVGIWLWLLALFGWMVLLVTLMYSYLPGFRVATMLESGLMTISAVLAIAGLVSWMGLLPYAVGLTELAEMAGLVDRLSLSLIGAGLFMGGAVTAWIGWDLTQIETLTVAWAAPAVFAGILAAPSPFVLPMPWLLVGAALVWLGWCLFLFTRKEIPSAYTEMK